MPVNTAPILIQARVVSSTLAVIDDKRLMDNSVIAAQNNSPSVEQGNAANKMVVQSDRLQA